MSSLEMFKKDVISKGGHILDVIQVSFNSKLVYYREYGSLTTDVKHKTIFY